MMLAGRYRLVRRIAGGGMGTVYEGFDERLERRVAAKVLNVEYADEPSFVERFGREARAVARLSHPNIAQVFDVGFDAGQHFIVMEYVDGTHLGQVLAGAGRFEPGRAARVAAQVCAALAAAHAAGIVHRDIKPANIMLAPGDQVKVTDFGIAQTAGQATLTGAGSVLGTAHYLSPEQAAGHGVTPASDVYAVGVLLFEMLTGAVPFAGESAVAVALSHVTQQVPPVHELVPGVPPSLAAVVARATAKDPGQRYADGGQMAAALHDATGTPSTPSSTGVLPVAATPEGQPVPGHRRTPGGRRLLAVAAVGLLLVGGALLGWAALTDGSPSPAADRAPAGQSPSKSKRSSPPSPAASSSEASATGPVVPADAVGSDVDELAQRLESDGYHVERVDVDSAASEKSVLATIPEPGEPLNPEQAVVLIASKGAPHHETDHVVVPDGIVGSDAKHAEQLLKELGLHVKKIDVDSTSPDDTVVATYPTAGSPVEGDAVVLAVSHSD